MQLQLMILDGPGAKLRLTGPRNSSLIGAQKNILEKSLEAPPLVVLKMIVLRGADLALMANI